MVAAIITFLVCALGIVFSGIRLSRYGDIIAEKSGMGRAWFGLIMMASVTSLPELISGISSVAIVHAPDLAVADIAGSCMFNILILSILDFFLTDRPISSRVQQSQVLGAGFGVIIITVALAALLSANSLPSLGWIGIPSLIIVVVYLVAMRTIYSFEQKRTVDAETTTSNEHDVPLNKAILYYLLNAVLVVIAALFLPQAGDKIASASGLGQTFVGTLLLALSTSLPELVVSIAALRIGAVDIAVGNIFGSNLFNFLILAIDDVFYTRGSLFKYASKSNLIVLVAALIMTGIAIIGLVYQQEKKRWKLAADTFAIAIVYLLTLLVLFFTRDMF
ncbi:MAG: hypothetical protein U0T75_01480 [Chitinophagales bacterium]